MLATVPDSIHVPFHRRIHVMLRSLVCVRLQMETLTLGMPGDPHSVGFDPFVDYTLRPPYSKRTRTQFAETKAAHLLAIYFGEYSREEDDDE